MSFSKQSEKIAKLIKKTLQSGVIVTEEMSARDVVEYCEKEGNLFSYKGLFIAPIIGKFKNSDCIRCVFVLKETDTGKVQLVDKLMEVVKDLEDVLIFLDYRNQIKIDGFVYFDTIKKIYEED